MNDTFDLRLPLGVLFVACGGILLGHGLFVGVRVVGININLWWGVVMLAFGGLFIGLFARARTR